MVVSPEGYKAARESATAAAHAAASKANNDPERIAAMSKQEREEAELEEAKNIEKQRNEKRDAEIAGSWTKNILVEGTGAEAYRGAQARVHIVGRATLDEHVTGRAKERGFVSGSVFEDSRARGCPVLLLLGRGILVPGLDQALLGMRAGEHAEVTIKPEGGYGAAGSVDNPVVPGSATLTYDVEVLSIEKEIELWDMSFEEKMKLAAERKQRGNTLVGCGHYLMADAEYEQAQRYLVFMPHPEEEQKALIAEAMIAVQLNLAATKLRLGREASAIKHAQDVLALDPDSVKAHYRLGQAHTQLGKTKLAEHHLELAEKAAAGDEASLVGIRKERERLQRRQEKHARDRKKAAERMVSGQGVEEEEEIYSGKDGETGDVGGKVAEGEAPKQRFWRTRKRLGQLASRMSALGFKPSLLLAASTLLVCVLALLTTMRDRGASNGMALNAALVGAILLTTLLFFLRVAPALGPRRAKGEAPAKKRQ